MNKIRDLIAKVEFLYATKFIQLDTHYTFFLDLNGPAGSFAVKFLKKYDGIIVEYTDVTVGENGLLTFNYDVISNVNNCNVKSKSFERFTRNVMRNMIYGAVKNLEKDLNENGKLDSVESDSQRTVHEEVTAVPQERVSNRKPRKKAVRANKRVHSEVQQSASNSSVGNQSEGVDKTF
jgi:hypothetical protein